MSVYVIGDVQGCFDSLSDLLKKIHYRPFQDQLWFTGDLVNRGPQSLDTLRFVCNECSKHGAKVVLGNHDLGMLCIARGFEPYLPKQHTFIDVLEAPDREELFLFLESLPLLHHDPNLGYTLVHAGLYPTWDLNQALSLSKEVAHALSDPKAKLNLYQHLYGDTPSLWNDNLQSVERLRFIINAFTRMRFVNKDGTLDLTSKGTLDNPPPNSLPWYKVTDRKNKSLKILFGHWAALNGKTDEENVFALDTGCAWGNKLTAMRLEDGQRFAIGCQ